MQSKERRGDSTVNNEFCDVQECIEKLRRMIHAGTINFYKAVQMLDEEMDSNSRSKDFYEENRLKIIDSLLL